MATGVKRNNLYYLDIEAIVHPNQLLNINSCANDDRSNIRPNVVDLKEIHSRMGHISHEYIKYLLQNTHGVTQITNNDKIDLKCCETCIRGKFTNQINKASSERRPYIGSVRVRCRTPKSRPNETASHIAFRVMRCAQGNGPRHVQRRRGQGMSPGSDMPLWTRRGRTSAAPRRLPPTR